MYKSIIIIFFVIIERMRNEWENPEMSNKKTVATQAFSPVFFIFFCEG
jgi:hypothetical protein